MNAKTGFRPFEIRGGAQKVKQYIEDLREQIVQVAQPQKIILFGSYACGQPHENSDVDLLVVMPFEGSAQRQAFKIRTQIHASRALDMLVRTPEYIAEQLAMDDFFLQEITQQGQVIYEAEDAAVNQKSGERLGQRAA
jgi:uncharacterized protein